MVYAQKTNGLFQEIFENRIVLHPWIASFIE
jgi:hypothetical protein